MRALAHAQATLQAHTTAATRMTGAEQTKHPVAWPLSGCAALVQYQRSLHSTRDALAEYHTSNISILTQDWHRTSPTLAKHKTTTHSRSIFLIATCAVRLARSSLNVRLRWTTVPLVRQRHAPTPSTVKASNNAATRPPSGECDHVCAFRASSTCGGIAAAPAGNVVI